MEKEIAEMRALLFKYEIKILVQRFPDILLQGITLVDDKIKCKLIVSNIYNALQNHDYLLAVDILSYEFGPLCAKGGINRVY